MTGWKRTARRAFTALLAAVGIQTARMRDGGWVSGSCTWQ